MRTAAAIKHTCLILGALCLLTLGIGAPARAQKAQPFVDAGKDGRLVYESDARGDRVPDFSYAGYAGGGIPLPAVPARVTVSPVLGDNGPRIQAALDYVGRLPEDVHGIRGAVLLQRGRYPIAGNLILRTSGVVLRGQGSGAEGTVLVATGEGRRTLIELKGAPGVAAVGPVRQVTDAYVPVNAQSLTLDNAEGLKVGDRVRIERPSPAAWLSRVGMAAVPGRPAPGWVADRMNVVWERRVQAIDGARITLDAPLTCALEKELGGARVTAYTWPNRLRQVGVENLRCDSAWSPANPADEEHAWMAITLSGGVEDAWVRNVVATHFVSTAVSIDETCARITVADCTSLSPVGEIAGYRRHSFYTAGQQTLFLRCRAESGRHDFSVGWMAAGPNAFVYCTAHNAHDFSGPIESWATGVLYDNITMDGGGLRLDNRELWDNGVGWAAANCVLWQCSVPVIVARTPPGAHNWVMGCWGQFSGDGSWRTPNEFVTPDSLYAGQLADRVGKEAAAQALAEPKAPSAESGALALADALRRSPPPPARPTPPKNKTLQKVEGQLLVGGVPLLGDQLDIAWWRGQAQPGRAETFGPSITRFVPGRVGPGLTDDLDALTDDMLAHGKATLRHHWGLWYDRRREDHEMIRRVDSDVWPPFYEQPWARTGTGKIWNGLSKYDLTKFNPWYFGRLHTFADLCAQKGLLLVDAMYFQHNILEAGAHWVDFPWRPANCVQPTGFPEPPPFVGKKRIFMAPIFYDVSNPVRRKLHQAFIRHCLDNLADCPNVVHVLGEEYSGPLSFTQFWLDTVAAWRADHPGKHVLIGLSAPRDVQDAILHDPKRAAQVDVIDFKYWWQAGKSVYAPKGGQNLAPRQSEREWKGGRPDDIDLARMATEYRRRFPDKAILCDFASARWAYLCAGGSQANLPRTTDRRLQQSIARMRPWSEETKNDQWAIREPGQGIMVHSAGPGPTLTLDLKGETGRFVVHAVDEKTGAVAPQGEPVTAGGVVTIPRPVGGAVTLWLTRE